MKNYRHLLSFAIVACLMCLPFAFGQDPVPAPEPSAAVELTAIDSALVPNEVEGAVLSAFGKLVTNYPWLATIILVMGMCRTFAKPLFSLIHTLVDLSPSKTDDGFLNSAIKFFHENAIGKLLAFALDWLTSIKIKAPSK